jgi:hypothetical protein
MPAVVDVCILFSEMPPWDCMGCKHTSKYTKNFFTGFGIFIYIASYIGGEMLLCKWERLVEEEAYERCPKFLDSDEASVHI